MAEREATGQPPGLTVQRTQEQEEDNEVSSSTPMETDMSGQVEDVGAHSLPQTYRASPPMAEAAHVAMATVSSPHSMAAPQSYIHPADYATVVMPHGSYVTVTSPDTVTSPQGGDVNTVTLPQTGHVPAVTLPQSGDFGSVTLPQTSHVSSVSLPQNVYVDSVHLPQTGDVGSVHLPQTGDVSSLSYHQRGSVSVSGGETDSMMPVTLPQTGVVQQMSSLHAASVGSLPHSGGVSNMSTAHMDNVNTMGSVKRAGVSQLEDVHTMTLPQTAVVVSQSHGMERDTQASSASHVPAEVTGAHALHAVDVASMAGAHAGHLTAHSHRGDYHSVELPHTQQPATQGSPHTPASAEVAGMSGPLPDDYRGTGLPHQHYGQVSKMEVVYTAAEESGLDIQHHSDVGLVSLPPTSGVSKMEAAYSLADVGAMDAQQHGNVRVITLPQTSDVSKMEVVYTTDDVSALGAHHGDIRVVSLPHTVDVSRLGVAYTTAQGHTQGHGDETGGLESQAHDYSRGNLTYTAADLSTSMAYTTADVNSAATSQAGVCKREEAYSASDLKLMTTAYAPEGYRMTVSYPPDTSATYTPADLSTMALHGASTAPGPQALHGASTAPGPQAEEGRRLCLSQHDTGRVGIQQHEAGRAGLQQHEAGRVGLQQHEAGLHQHEAGRVGLHQHEAGLHQHEAGRAGLHQHQAGRVGLQQHEAGRAGLHQHEAGRVGLQQHDDSRMNLPHTADVRPHSVPQAASPASVSVAQHAAQYRHTGSVDTTQAGSMVMEHASSHGVVSLPQTADMSSASTPARSEAYDVSRLNVPQQAHADDINMHMMAEAAEIISRGTASVDEVNMRLMAEAADYISRNVPQTSVITTATSLSMSAVNGRMVGQTTAPTTTLAGGQTSSTVAGGHTASTMGGTGSQATVAYTSGGQTPHTASVSAGKSTDTLKPASRGKGGATKGDQSDVAEKEMKTEQGMEVNPDYDIIPGFRAEFFQSQSYASWRRIGMAHRLHSDEEIACFLTKYYDNTSAKFPSGNTACRKCQHQLTVSCVTCMQHAAEDSAADGDDGEDSHHGDVAGDEARKQLWKIILEASSKEKDREKHREKDKTRETRDRAAQPDKPSNRRKPEKTRRVLQRSVKGTPKSYHESRDDKDSDSQGGQSDLPAVHFEQQSKSLTPGPRKRGRPSKDSYRLVSTLECSGCGKKFHTTVGLEKHIKLKRCKLSPSGGEEEEQKKTPSKSGTPSAGECSDCKKQFRSKQGLMLHRVAKHGEVSPDKYRPAVSDDEDTEDTSPPSKLKSTPSMYECSDCGKKYRSRQGMMLHRVSKHSEVTPDRKIKQEADMDVGESSSDGDKMTTRMRGSLVLQCTECDKKYNSRPGLMLHIRTKHSPLVLLDCTFCPLKFKTKLELRIHIRREHSEGRLILFCPYCSDTFHDRDVLKDHMADKHKTCRQVLYDCFACDLQFSSRIERKRHIQSEHKGKDTSLTCRFCGHWFATRLEFSQHEKDGHTDQSQSWLCATCGDEFPTRYLLQRHTLSHKEKIDCELCGKSITEPCFEDHMKRHYGTKAWQCDLCPKNFIRKAELQQHILVHKDERPFCCELCGVRYREKSRLNSHMRTHSGVKPYKCSQCEKAFTRSRELKNHMRVHTGEKPFSCTVCGRKFASSGNLSAHRRKVHKLSPIPHGQQSRRHMLEEKTKGEKTDISLLPPLPDPQHAHPNTHSLPPPQADPSNQPLPQADPNSHPPPQEAPLAHTAPMAHQAPLAHQAPIAHQAPVAHQDTALYQQHPIAKYEPLVTQPEHYIPQPVIHPPQTSLPMYWPNSSYQGDP